MKANYTLTWKVKKIDHNMTKDSVNNVKIKLFAYDMWYLELIEMSQD
jgi:hypothetical protein